MDFGITKEQEMLKKEARKFLEKECTEELVRNVEKSERGYSPELWKKIADLGWLGLSFPEAYGGLGGNLIDQMIIYEEMGKAMFPGPYGDSASGCFRRRRLCVERRKTLCSRRPFGRQNILRSQDRKIRPTRTRRHDFRH
jgi:hypothetical protein